MVFAGEWIIPLAEDFIPVFALAPFIELLLPPLW